MPSDSRRPLEGIDIERLRVRSRIIRATHHFFEAQGYAEVHPPVLVPSPGMEPHIAAMPVGAEHTKGMYLHTSPEFALKTLLGAGFDNLYALTTCFRDEPHSQTHSPQFTMLEWYGVGLSLMDLMTETEAFIKSVIHTCSDHLSPSVCKGLSLPFKRMTVREIFIQEANIDPWQYPDAQDFRAAAIHKGSLLSPQSCGWDDIFFDLFMNEVEPTLKEKGPLFLWGWPSSKRLCHDWIRMTQAEPCDSNSMPVGTSWRMPSMN